MLALERDFSRCVQPETLAGLSRRTAPTRSMPVGLAVNRYLISMVHLVTAVPAPGLASEGLARSIRASTDMEEFRSMNDAISTIILPKAPTGISGFDEITLGGLPAGRSTLICGGAGCGKTLFATTFLVQGVLQFNEPGVFISFEEREEDLSANFASLGYDLTELVNTGKLVIDHVRVERSEFEENGEYDLEGLFLRIDFAVSSIGARRVVLDTVETLFSGFTNAALIRAELRRLFGWMKDRGLTAIVTGERGPDGMLTRQGLEEYVADCVILLDNRVKDQITTRRLRVMKYRGSAHGADEYPFLIDSDGISVLPASSPVHSSPVSSEILSTGIEGLDDMFQKRGLYRGSSILLTGDAGSGKTTMTSHFIAAACARGERCLFFGFEEEADEACRNALSVNIDLKKWMDAGMLCVDVARSGLYGLEMHLARIHRGLEAFKPDLVIVDPISAFYGLGPDAHATVLRMMNLFKSKGATALYTSLQHNGVPVDHGLTSLMDTWIKLMDIDANGERNHVIYVMKARGLSHSSQVREYRITNSGVKLITPYIGPDGVLTGSARATQEAREQATTTDRQQEIERRRRDLGRRRETLEAEIATLAAALEDTKDEATKILGQDDAREAMLARSSTTMAARRGTT
jgi:circadian clock protein KaiC